ncbi:MAG: VWA domain-containing protein [Oscillospiraceae bacterium]|nr:VWA domain-containing protein [Oscillospiraceae bacterium]
MKKQSIRALLLSGMLLASALSGCAANSKDAAVNEMKADVMYYPEEAYVDVMEPDWNTEEYDYLPENSFQSVAANPFATFAADVDTASYSNFRRQIVNGQKVQPDSVRVEEFINYFHYDYPEPESDEPFSVSTEIAPCPWNEKTQLLSVGLQTKRLNADELPRSNLVFLIDVSGSMDSSNKLPLVQRSFLTLVETLDQNDMVSIVTYSSGERVILEGMNGSEQQKIAAAIEGLVADGCTQGDKAIQMAYEIAEQHFIDGGINRVIMATDGDFNVGITSEGELTRLIQEKAKSGVYLSVLGYGMGNYKDNKLESMADNGNGNYAYIDTIDEARRVLVNEAGGTLFTVAKDVKLQLEFNPAQIKGYRLIGYENRVMSAADFADDSKDGGEIGAGHQITALFEIVPVDSDFEIPSVDSKYGKTETGSAEFADELCTLNIRYKAPESSESVLQSYAVAKDAFHDTMSDNLRWAAGVAEVAMVLRDSAYKGTSSLEHAKELLTPAANDDFRTEFLELISKLE